MRVAAFALAFACMATPLAAQDVEEPALPAWMAGCWEMRDGERWAEECWTIPRGGMMLGSGRAGTGDKVASWETMRIALAEPNGDGPVVRMAFVAAPGGTGWTTFGWSPAEDEGVTFHNAANEYPQRVRYWREGELLNAETSLEDGTRPIRWTFRRMGE
jgi:hypothetical protein